MNGNQEGDEDGKETYVGYKGATTIDYIFTEETTYQEISKYEIAESIESDHMPQVITWEGQQRDKKFEMNKVEKQIWTEEGIEYFKEKISERKEEILAASCSEKTEEILRECVQTKIIKIKDFWEPKFFDHSCWKGRRQTKTALKNWREGVGTEREYKTTRKEYKKLCKKKKEEEKNKMKERLKNVKNINQAWEYINGNRKGKKKNETIKPLCELIRRRKLERTE